MFPPCRWPHIALAFPSQNHGTMNTDPQLDPKEMEFWMASKTPVLWLFRLHSWSWSMTRTKSEGQGRKGKKRGKGNSNTGTVWREEWYIWHAWRGSTMNSHKFMTVDNILGEYRVWEHQAHISCLKNGENNLEYIQINDLYTSQPPSTCFRQHGWNWLFFTMSGVLTKKMTSRLLYHALILCNLETTYWFID